MLRVAGLVMALLGLLLAPDQARAAGWAPTQDDSFDVQFTTPFNLMRRAKILELDLFDTSVEQIRQLKAKGVRTVCYINAGAWENWRPDSRDYPAKVIGRNYAGWPGERWLDIREHEALAPILDKRLELCRSKGFDGVDLDNVDGYANRTGFPLTAKDQLDFNRWLAKEARDRELAVGLKNSLELVPELVKDFDFAVSESCFSEDACGALEPFLKARKAAFVIEYTNVRRKMDAHCKDAAELGLQVIFKTKSLNGKLHRRCP
jgi:hypothetical protein